MCHEEQQAERERRKGEERARKEEERAKEGVADASGVHRTTSDPAVNSLKIKKGSHAPFYRGECV